MRRWLAGSVCALLLAAGAAAAAEEIPPPPQMTEQAQPIQMTMGESTDVRIQVYGSTESAAALLAFYRAELPKRGWQSYGPDAAQLQGMTQAPPHVLTSLQHFVQETALFHKGNDLLQVVAGKMDGVPGTCVRVNRWRAPQERAPVSAGGARSLTPTEAHPHVDDSPYLPRYPGAKRVLGTGEFADGSAMRTYQTTDAAPEVVAFYQRAMPQAGWAETRHQTEEQPLPVEATANGLRGVIKQEFLEYRGYGGFCDVSVVAVPTAPAQREQPQGEEEGGTIIMLTYYRMQDPKLREAIDDTAP